MLHPNIVQLKQFYASRLGETVALFITRALERLWSQTAGDATLVIGYGAPYVMPEAARNAPLIMAMQAEQGALAWPSAENNHVILTSEGELPLQNNSIGRVLLIHSIEYSEQLNAMMQEVWRVLVPGGRVLAVVPNRMSLWSGSKTPFGFGRPFNVLQLKSLLAHHQFTFLRSSSALFAPPFMMRFSPKLSQKVETLGRLLWWFLGGVIIVEAEKQLYASVSDPVFASLPQRLRAAAQQTATASSREQA